MKHIMLFFLVFNLLSFKKPIQLVEKINLVVDNKTYVLKEENFFAVSTFDKISSLQIKEFNPEVYTLEVKWKVRKTDVQSIQPKSNNALTMFAPKFLKPQPEDWIVFTLVDIKSEQPKSFKITFKD